LAASAANQDQTNPKDAKWDTMADSGEFNFHPSFDDDTGDVKY
jgi:hypothetical protein